MSDQNLVEVQVESDYTAQNRYILALLDEIKELKIEKIGTEQLLFDARKQLECIPCLVTACQKAVDYIETESLLADDMEEPHAQWAIDSLYLAIAKAEGQTP